MIHCIVMTRTLTQVDLFVVGGLGGFSGICLAFIERMKESACGVKGSNIRIQRQGSLLL